MNLFRWVLDTPFQIEGEGSMATRSFQVGANAGAHVVTSIEKTDLGVIVKRANAPRDLILDGPGSGELMPSAEGKAAAMKDAHGKR